MLLVWNYVNLVTVNKIIYKTLCFNNSRHLNQIIQKTYEKRIKSSKVLMKLVIQTFSRKSALIEWSSIFPISMTNRWKMSTMAKQISASIFEIIVTWEATSEKCSKSSLIHLRRRYFRTRTIFAVQTTKCATQKNLGYCERYPVTYLLLWPCLCMYFLYQSIFIIKFVAVFIIRELLMFFLGRCPVCQWHACQIFLYGRRCLGEYLAKIYVVRVTFYLLFSMITKQ